MTGPWTLPDDPTAARAARRHVADALSQRPELDDALLVASELAANAVRHGRPPIELRLDVDARTVRITVSDHGDATAPRIVSADPADGHGRGLAIIAGLAREVGWSRDGDRLDVWAELGSDPS